MEERFHKKAEFGYLAELVFRGSMGMKELHFLSDSIRRYKISRSSLTGDGNVRVRLADAEQLAGFLEDADKAEISVMGAYEREKIKVYTNVLSGLGAEDVFDVRPYAEMARRQVDASDVSSRIGICFSGTPVLPEESHGCRMAFTAQPGTEPLFDVKICLPGQEWFLLAEHVDAGRFLSYLKIGIFLLTRDAEYTEESFRSAFWPCMAKLSDEERTSVTFPDLSIVKPGQGNMTCGPRVIPQRQPELYSIVYHPYGGAVNVAFWKKLENAIGDFESIELRLSREKELYVCNLLAEEIARPLDAFRDGAFAQVEFSPASDRCVICGAGTYDPQFFTSALLQGLHKIPELEKVLPQVAFSGCFRACHAVKKAPLTFVNQEEAPIKNGDEHYFEVRHYTDGKHYEAAGRIHQSRTVEFLTALAALIREAGSSAEEWLKSNEMLLQRLAELYREKKSGETVTF